jgi:SAM-dependent methyltransferase
VRGEDLAARFPPASFDVAYARNAVDHSADPVAVLAAMAAVVRAGGLVALRHYRNEADREHYAGLHGWNLDARDGALVIWRRGEEHRVPGFDAWLDAEYVLATRWCD